MGATSGAREFSALLEADRASFESHGEGPNRALYRREDRWVAALLRLSGQVKALLGGRCR